MPELRDFLDQLATTYAGYFTGNTGLPRRTERALDIYVAGRAGGGGLDTNSGTIGSPLATLEAADARIPVHQRHLVQVHLDRGPHVLPSRGYFLGGRVLDAELRVFADESFDSGVVTEVVAAGVAQAGSEVRFIVCDNLGLDDSQVYGLTIEFLTLGGVALAAEARPRVLIRNYDGTTLYLTNPLPSAAPQVGDEFRIISSNCIVQEPDLGAAPLYQDYHFCRGFLASSRPAGFEAQLGTGIVQLEGLRFAKSQSFSELAFGAGTYVMHGCWSLDPGEGTPWNFSNSQIHMGVSDNLLWRGWGNRFYRRFGKFQNCGVTAFGAVGVGTADLDASTSLGPSIIGIRGGRAARMTAATQVDYTVRGESAIDFWLDAVGTPNAPLLAETGARVTLLEVLMQGEVAARVEAGARLRMTDVPGGNTVGGDSMVVQHGGVVELGNAPEYGSATLHDWVIDGERYNKGWFNAANRAVLGNHGSRAVRLA